MLNLLYTILPIRSMRIPDTQGMKATIILLSFVLFHSHDRQVHSVADICKI